MAYSQAQLIALDNINSGDIFVAPDISSDLIVLNTLGAVESFRNMQAANLSELTSNNVTLVKQLGSSSFPQIFGAIPAEFTQYLGYGSLFDIAESRLSQLVPTANVFIEIINQSSVYVSQSNDILNSITTIIPTSANQVTGGLAAISGIGNLTTVGTRFQELGSLLLNFSNPSSGFSASSIFLNMIQNNAQTVGNLHINLFGKQIVDPRNGNLITVDQNLFTTILSNPVSAITTENSDGTISTSYAVAALHPLEAPLIKLANNALTLTGDFDAFVTYLGIGDDVINAVNVFSDCLDIQTVLGSTVIAIILTEQNLPLTSNLTADILIPIIINNVKGISNVPDISILGQAMQAIIPPQINSIAVTSNSSPNISNIQSMIGVSGNVITIQDVLGTSNIADVLLNTISILETISSESFNDIKLNTSVLSNALINGISGTVILSDGSTYTDINVLVAAAVPLINSESSSLSTAIPQVFNQFIPYGVLAQTHNNSVNIMKLANINIANIASNQIPVTTTSNFLQQLSSLAQDTQDEVTPFINQNSTSGAALSVSIIESQNTSILANYGIVLQSNLI